MERETSEHFQTADRNRDLARTLLHAPTSIGPTAASLEWAAVIAFYAAVHYVNGYLRERYQLEPVDHAERSRYVRSDPLLRRCASAYSRLRDEGYRCRYHRAYRLMPQQAHGLINVALANVESVVRSAI